jgi:hypothetical protein
VKIAKEDTKLASGMAGKSAGLYAQMGQAPAASNFYSGPGPKKVKLTGKPKKIKVLFK